MDYTKSFTKEEATVASRRLTDEAMEWLNAVRGKTIDYHESARDSWAVTVGDTVVGFYDSRDAAVAMWSQIMQQRVALGLILGNGAQSRQWFAHGEGQKRVSNSTGWTDI